MSDNFNTPNPTLNTQETFKLNDTLEANFLFVTEPYGKTMRPRFNEDEQHFLSYIMQNSSNKRLLKHLVSYRPYMRKAELEEIVKKLEELKERIRQANAKYGAVRKRYYELLSQTCASMPPSSRKKYTPTLAARFVDECLEHEQLPQEEKWLKDTELERRDLWLVVNRLIFKFETLLAGKGKGRYRSSDYVLESSLFELKEISQSF